jgi:hypothetical protein
MSLLRILFAVIVFPVLPKSVASGPESNGVLCRMPEMVCYCADGLMDL